MCADKDATDSFYEKHFVAKQPIFTDKQKLHGYELLFRSAGNTNRAVVIDDTLASSKVIIDGLPMALADLNPQSKAFINIPEAMLLDKSCQILPKDRCVIEVLETVKSSKAILDELKKLYEMGYTIALDDYTGHVDHDDFLPYINIVKVDFLQVTDYDERAAIYRHLKDVNPRLSHVLAEKVETMEDFKKAAECGYSLFQGYFFQKPELVSGRKVNARQESQLRLLHLFNSDGFSISDVENLLKRDSALTYRLLKFVNSPLLPPHNNIYTVGRAVTYLGLKHTRSWLMAAIIADGCKNDLKLENALIGTVRGFFLQWLAAETHAAGEDDAFTLGLFSILEAMYDMSFETLLQGIPVAPEIHDALCDGHGPLKEWLPMMDMLENGEMEKMKEIACRIGVSDMQKIASQYHHASKLAAQV